MTNQTNIPTFILASQSKIRRQVLENAGIDFIPMNSNVDEENAKISMRELGLKPGEQAHELAKLKAQKLSKRHAEVFVLGCDQMLELDGEAFDKAASMDEARERLKHFRGKTHYLRNAIVIYKNGEFIWRYDAASKLVMRDFSDEFLDYYLQTAGEDILSSVGCYQLEGLGVQLFSEIDGDYFSILGLPLIPVLDFLRLHKVVKA